MYRQQDEYGGPAVGFTWQPDAARDFAQLTGQNKDRLLAIILDGVMQSAPRIREQISESGIISGEFTQETRDNLLYVLDAGSLPVALTLEGKSFVGASLGEDSIRRGIRAILIGGILVMVFMAGYYLVCGLVADFALFLNLVLICGALSLFRATLTLPGMAGLLLTVGMAVDANVLIFERIREELDRGRATTLALKNGYERAFRTIFDANITTLITALILYRVGTATVKGFAVTLSMGIVCSMFTAIYVSRAVFMTLIDAHIMKRFRMHRLFQVTNLRFVSKTGLMMLISGVLIASGLTLFFTRGRKELLDTDFLGGSYLQLTLKEKTPIADVRRRLLDAGLKEVHVAARQDDAAIVGGTEAKEFGLRARLDRDEDTQKAVAAFEEAVRKIFKDDIDVQNVDVADVQVSQIPKGGPQATDPYLGGSRVLVRFDKDLRRDFFLRGLKKAGFDGLYELDETPQAAEKAVAQTYRIKLKPKDDDNKPIDRGRIEESLKDVFAAPIYFKQVEFVGGVVAKEMQEKALVAILLSFVAIVAYVSIRFGNLRYGLAAVVALVHDVAFTMGAIAFFNWITTAVPQLDFLGVGELRINLPVVAALLTIIGYSLNDTIVVFDRIRENVAGKNPLSALLVNRSINQTLGRTVLTSVTTFLAVVVLYLLGGRRIHSFAFIMLIGIVVGTYSSIFIASPILLSPRQWKLPPRDTEAAKT